MEKDIGISGQIHPFRQDIVISLLSKELTKSSEVLHFSLIKLMAGCAQKVALVVSEKEIRYCQGELISEMEKVWHKAGVPYLEPDLWPEEYSSYRQGLLKLWASDCCLHCLRPLSTPKKPI